MARTPMWRYAVPEQQDPCGTPKTTQSPLSKGLTAFQRSDHRGVAAQEGRSAVLSPGLSLGYLPRCQNRVAAVLRSAAREPDGNESRSAGRGQHTVYFSTTLPLSFAPTPATAQAVCTKGGALLSPVQIRRRAACPPGMGSSFFRT